MSTLITECFYSVVLFNPISALDAPQIECGFPGAHQEHHPTPVRDCNSVPGHTDDSNRNEVLHCYWRTQRLPPGPSGRRIRCHDDIFTPFGRFKYLRLLFGVTHAGDEYSRQKVDAFDDISSSRRVVEDVIVFSASYEEQKQLVRTLLACADDHHIAINIDKIVFAEPDAIRRIHSWREWILPGSQSHQVDCWIPYDREHHKPSVVTWPLPTSLQLFGTDPHCLGFLLTAAEKRPHLRIDVHPWRRF